MKCPSCLFENLPIRETSTVIGSKVCLPSHCAECGAALTMECPVCTYAHAIGTKFCQSNGVSISQWQREERFWGTLVQNAEATLTVRPATSRISVFLAMLPGLYLVGGYWIHELSTNEMYTWDPASLILDGIVALAFTLFAAAVPTAIPLNIIGAIEKRRRRKMFGEHKFSTLTEERAL